MFNDYPFLFNQNFFFRRSFVFKLVSFKELLPRITLHLLIHITLHLLIHIIYSLLLNLTHAPHQALAILNKYLHLFTINISPHLLTVAINLNILLIAHLLLSLLINHYKVLAQYQLLLPNSNRWQYLLLRLLLKFLHFNLPPFLLQHYYQYLQFLLFLLNHLLTLLQVLILANYSPYLLQHIILMFLQLNLILLLLFNHLLLHHQLT